MSKLKEFLVRKDIVISPQRYLIDALGAMAQGLFASLLIGTIIKTVGQQTGLALLVDLGGYATAMSGPAMACAIGWALHCPPLVLFSLITVGYSANALGGAGGPLAVLIIAIAAAELGKAVSKETKVDILVTPLVTIFAGVGLSMLIAAPIGAAASQVGTLIMWATEQAPLVMGILVSVIVGVALTLPISSAAICAALGLTGLAGGAAVAGCCAQMVGFAVMSYKENGVGGLVSQGLGTSMLQMGNIIKNPRIWIAPTLASAITGPLATCLFHFEMNGAAVSSGMGTCGLVGQIGVYTGWVSDIAAGTKAAIGGGMPVDVVSAATPLAYLKTGDLEGLKQIASVGDMFLGKVGGSMGEVSALMLLIGGLYLIWRKVINWQTPVAYIATVAVLTVLFPKAGGAEYMLYSIFGGGLFLGAFFMATDYVTSPITAKGQIVFGICLGILTGLFRIFGSGAEGVSYAIIFCNMLVPLIEKVTLPTAFGKGGKKNGSK